MNSFYFFALVGGLENYEGFFVIFGWLGEIEYFVFLAVVGVAVVGELGLA